jgi:hypothetical protein
MATGQQVCIHLDINKTIILSDASSGKGFFSAVESLLSECCWGFVKGKSIHRDDHSTCAVSDWVPFTTISLSSTPPELSDELVSLSPGLDKHSSIVCTFGTFVEDHTDLSKAEQKSLKSSFSEQTFGQHVALQLWELLDKLKISAEAMEAVRIAHDQLRRGGDLIGCEYLLSGYFHILPSFFVFLDFLAEQLLACDAAIADARIVFRSFGVDIARVAHELNLYCSGKHPVFTSKYKLDGSVSRSTDHQSLDFRLHFPTNSGSFLRTGQRGSDLHLARIGAEQVSLFA